MVSIERSAWTGENWEALLYHISTVSGNRFSVMNSGVTNTTSAMLKLVCIFAVLATTLAVDGDFDIDIGIPRAKGTCQFRCVSDGSCLLDFAQTCDGVEDCPQGEDEDCGSLCDPETCLLRDNCHCLSTSPPGGLEPKDVPQMILINTENEIPYSGIFSTRSTDKDGKAIRVPRKNPNGCQATGTFFFRHEYTNYAYVKQVYARGHEIGSLSIRVAPRAAFSLPGPI
ncbi:PREDICTED: uncharacterized protein LOC106810566 [Priapulus caudatus]|uniref:Uncharacterized protein LOC106810566 n=1 Tax=Priapulus caudatus TaxID=37621 RepID=A0ABM1EB69_PRICU|nr:PREDICTED: uncharacterized protein LOC106810566 [Priapulus caudatus]